MASSRLLRGRNQPQNLTPWAAGGRVPLRLWQGLRSTRPPAPEEVHHDEVTPRLTNPYIAKTMSAHAGFLAADGPGRSLRPGSGSGRARDTQQARHDRGFHRNGGSKAPEGRLRRLNDSGLTIQALKTASLPGLLLILRRCRRRCSTMSMRHLVAARVDKPPGHAPSPGGSAGAATTRSGPVFAAPRTQAHRRRRRRGRRMPPASGDDLPSDQGASRGRPARRFRGLPTAAPDIR